MASIGNCTGRSGLQKQNYNCTICDGLWDALTSDEIEQNYSIEHPDSALFLTNRGGDPHLFFLKSGGARHRQPLRFLIPESQNDTKLLRYGRILDPEWIDIGLIKGWIASCVTQHGEPCVNPFKTPQAYPDWLIDTMDARIVPGNGITNYVAMSYRWGASAGFRTEGLEPEVIRNPGALKEADIADRIPQTIADAIKLVQSIGERYLWVDALCIDQSNKAHLGRQLELMGAIYASAKLTIIVADGDATSGIKGLKGISSSRPLIQRILPLSEETKIIMSQMPDFSGKGGSKYFQRGWTHQEFVLSKRRLIFAKGQVFWQCTGANWYEDWVPSWGAYSEPRFWQDNMNLLDSSLLYGQLDLKVLSRVLGEYNRREHSYAEDALPGIIGLLSVIGRHFNGGFLCGLPEACFDSALLWHVDGGDPSEIRRRVDSGKNHSTFPSILPSWSWIGWQTPTLEISPGESLDRYSSSRTCLTTPITRWFAREFPNSVTERLIQPTWFGFRKGLGPDNPPLRYGYKFNPFYPITGTYEDQMPWSPPQTPFISCRTTRGWLKAGRYKPLQDHGQLGLDKRAMILSSERCDNCGLIRPHTGVNTLLGAELNGTLTIELAAICSQRMCDWNIFGDAKDHDVYGVLWIHWIDGVAYRQGSGWVYKEVWEAHDVEDVDLLLG
ncbi:heterokaryon incompatibility protein-domain-containing protein [Xylaria longipes]|nr:heterokaryon incompatibility protein-domain-containing protein [Xylaria longipes]